MFALQGLNAGHFIQTFGALPLLGSFNSRFVHMVDVSNFSIKAFFILRCQPVTAQMWLDISLFLKAWLHDAVKFQTQFLV
jgi:hypothetical protein